MCGIGRAKYDHHLHRGKVAKLWIGWTVLWRAKRSPPCEIKLRQENDGDVLFKMCSLGGWCQGCWPWWRQQVRQGALWNPRRPFVQDRQACDFALAGRRHPRLDSESAPSLAATLRASSNSSRSRNNNVLLCWHIKIASVWLLYRTDFPWAAASLATMTGRSL